jgi:hypothetical protein
MPSPFGCARCGHPRALHSNGKTSCKAIGCDVGGGETCPGFVYALAPPPELIQVSLTMLEEAQ